MSWLGTWAYRIKITIDHTNIDSNLTHFPLPVALGTSVGIGSADVTDVFDEIGSSYLKMALTKDDGTTQLYCEVEQWDTGNERALLWVSLSTFTISSSTDTDIYLYFDSAQADNTSYIGDPGSRSEVWSSILEAVFTMAQTPGGAGSILDSTSNGYDGTPVNMSSGDLENGPVMGLALDLEDSKYINIGELPEMASWGLLAHVYCDSAGNSHNVISNDLSGWNDDVLFGIDPENVSTDNRFGAVHQDKGSHVRTLVTDTANLSSSTPYQIVLTSDGSLLKLYVDGALKDSSAKNGTALTFGNNGVQNTYLGRAPNAVRPWVGGPVSTIMIFNSDPGAAWIKADFYGEDDNLVTWGTIETDEDIILEDFSLDLAVYYQKYEDLNMMLQAHDGLEFRDLKMLLEAADISVDDFITALGAYYQGLESFDMDLETLATKYDIFNMDLAAHGEAKEVFKTLFEAIKAKHKDFSMILQAISGTSFNDFMMILAATDGSVYDNFSMLLHAISAPPTFRSVMAQRVSSVISEVS